VVEYSGVDPVVPIETSSGAVASTPDAVAHAGTLQAGDGNMIVAAFADGGVGSIAVTPGYSEIGRDDLFSMVAEGPAGYAGAYSPTAMLRVGYPTTARSALPSRCARVTAAVAVADRAYMRWPLNVAAASGAPAPA
jgi:hypothetical protein